MAIFAAAARDVSPAELRRVLGPVPIVGGELRVHGRWCSGHLLHHKAREIEQALDRWGGVALVVLADGMWKMTLFGAGIAPAPVYFEPALAEPGRCARLEGQLGGSGSRLARLLALPRSDWPAPGMPFAQAAAHVVEGQARRLQAALGARGIEHDPEAVRAAMRCRDMSAAEWEWECTNLPRLLSAMGVAGVFQGWQDLAEPS